MCVYCLKLTDKEMQKISKINNDYIKLIAPWDMLLQSYIKNVPTHIKDSYLEYFL